MPELTEEQTRMAFHNALVHQSEMHKRLLTGFARNFRLECPSKHEEGHTIALHASQALEDFGIDPRAIEIERTTQNTMKFWYEGHAHYLRDEGYSAT